MILRTGLTEESDNNNKFISVPSFLISVGTVLFVFGNMSNLK